ncbi:MAG: transcription elongation factor GreB [Pseudomonadales bacterium]|jgi:transcription elongation factor GreB|nr:transcription elongation factor GreB [Pseudomonadales bacterium]
MSRRPPSPASEPRSPYVTPAGAAALQAELRHLWKEKRPEVTRRVSEAAALGDRSENAEYIYGKKQLREIDRRIRYLTKRLDEVVVVDRLPADPSRVFFGAWVEVEDEDGETRRWRIVGADEFDPGRAWISIDSPAARALVGKRVGEEVVVRGPEGDRHLWITEIDYESP